MKKLILLLPLLLLTTFVFGETYFATATKSTKFNSYDSENVWYDCEIPITIVIEPGCEKLIIYTPEIRIITLESFTKKEFYNYVETNWYDAVDKKDGKCKVMLQFLPDNKIAIGIQYNTVAYKYITLIK